MAWNVHVLKKEEEEEEILGTLCTKDTYGSLRFTWDWALCILSGQPSPGGTPFLKIRWSSGALTLPSEKWKDQASVP